MSTTLPSPVEEGVRDAVQRLGSSARIEKVTPVAGGCINHGVRLDTDHAGAFFLKWNASAPPRLFDAEAEGLNALREAGALRVPEPLARGGGSGSPSWLLMEWLEPGAPGPDYAVTLGRGLARTHASASDAAGFGWRRPNWIGSLPQLNRVGRSWSAFWRDQRLAPQFRRAVDRGHFGPGERRLFATVLALVPDALADVDSGPVHLLHGDLWGGNAFAGQDGAPVVIDPAAYRGHGEVDLAMTELFGGFGRDFYDAYASELSISDAYHAYRRDLYQLYYLLVHVNLFGSQYERRTVGAAERVAAAVGA